MRALCTSRFTPRRALALVLSLAAGLLVAACGGAGHRAPAARPPAAGVLLAKTFAATSAIDSGQIDLHLAVALTGSGQLAGQPLSLDVSGPFQRDGSGRLGTDLTITLTKASKTHTLGVDVVDGAVYVGVGGTFYELPSNILHARHAGGGGSTGASGISGLFGALGIDPRSWLTDPHDAGTATIGGVNTAHFTAGVDTQRAVADLSKLIGQRLGGATGANGPSTSTVTAELQLIASAITSAQLDVYTGTSDHVVRRIHLGVVFTVPSALSALAGGLTGGSLDFDATLTQLNAPQSVSAPANSRPFSALGGGLSKLAGGLGGGQIARLPLSILG
jgi:hypothetical protein